MRLQTKITKVVRLEGQTFSVTTSPKTQAVAHSSYKGSGLIKRKQSDGKRERTQITFRANRRYLCPYLSNCSQIRTYRAKERQTARGETRKAIISARIHIRARPAH
jgi:hypothetical protein